jgi:hypothetical protein
MNNKPPKLQDEIIKINRIIDNLEKSSQEASPEKAYVSSEVMKDLFMSVRNNLEIILDNDRCEKLQNAYYFINKLKDE